MAHFPINAKVAMQMALNTAAEALNDDANAESMVASNDVNDELEAPTINAANEATQYVTPYVTQDVTQDITQDVT